MVTTHLVQFSTGLGSAEVARRVVEAYGVNNVHLLTADTLAEDDDNWRFAREAHTFIKSPEWLILADGRTPMQVGRDERVVPNDRMPVCTKILKRQLLRKHINTNYDPANTVIHLGYDWTEPQRHQKAAPNWAPFEVRSVLMDPPYVHKAMLMFIWRSRYGIEPPRLYDAGFGHANCGGACVRGGQASWQRLLEWNRERYLEWEGEEETTREFLGKDVSILRSRKGGTSVPLTLRRFREELDKDSTQFDPDDVGACGCT